MRKSKKLFYREINEQNNAIKQFLLLKTFIVNALLFYFNYS